MRRVFLLAAIVLFYSAPISAQERPVLEGVAFTEGRVGEIKISIWALGSQVAENPEWQFEPVAVGTAAPGKPFSIEIGEVRLPVAIELTAKGHVAVGLEVVLDEQMRLPKAWLRKGGVMTLRAARGAEPAADALVWGRIVPNRSTFDPWRWRTVVPRSSVPPSGRLPVTVPDMASWVAVQGLNRDLEFGSKETADVEPGSTTRLALDSIAATVRVFDRRGQPAPGVNVIETTSPASIAPTSDNDGYVEIQIPGSGPWAIAAAVGDDVGQTLGSSVPDGEIDLQLGTGAATPISWPEEADPVVLQLTAQSPIIGGSPRMHRGGSAGLQIVSTGRISLRSWGPKMGFSTSYVQDPTEPVVLEKRPPARIVGRVTVPEGVAVDSLPVYVRMAADWTMRRYGRTAFSSDVPLRRQWLPWAVTANDGRFLLPNLPPGAYELEVRVPGFPAALSGPVFAKDGTMLELEITVAAGARLSLTVVDPEGAPIEGVAVEAFRAPPNTGGLRSRPREGTEPDAHSTTDPEGRTMLDAVPVGHVRLALSRAGYVATNRTSIEVPAEGLDLGVVTLKPGVTVRGIAVDPDGEPVAGAEVAMSTGPDDGWFRATTTADDNGRFTLLDLDPVNEIYLRARSEGLVPEPPLKVELPPDGEVEVSMIPERFIEGVVIAQEDETPIVGAMVNTSIQAMVGAMRRSVGTGERIKTGEDGSFRIGGLREGMVELHVTAPARRGVEHKVSIPADVDPDRVVVRLEEGLELRGRVETETGEPAPGLEVNAMGSSRRISGGAVIMDSSETRTGQDGSFRFDDLGPGSYRVFATGKDGSSAEASASAGQDQMVILRLEAGEVVSGSVVAEDGAPIAGAEVVVLGRGFRGPPPTTECGADGRFRIENVQPGEVTVYVEAEGYVSEREKTEVVSGAGAEVQVRLARGGTVVGVIRGLSASELEGTWVASDNGARTVPAGDGTFELDGVEPGEREISARTRSSGRAKSVRTTVALGDAGEPVVIDFSGGLTVSGRVLRRGNPVAGTAVSANRVGEYSLTSTVTDSDGGYRIEGLEAGEYEIAARSRGNDVLAGDHVLLDADAEIDLHIAGVRLEGRVLEAESGNPVEGASILLKSVGLPAVSRSAVSDASGEFVMEDLRDGEFRVTAEAGGMSPAQEVVTLVETSPGQVLLSMEPEARTVFVVREPDGSPAENLVVLTHGNGVQGPSAFATCDPEGRCEVGDIPPGSWTVLLRGKGAALLHLSFPAGDVPVQMKPKGLLKVIAPPSDGGAAWQARVTEAASGLIAPAIDWRNRGLGEWLPVTAPSLTLYVPQGLYRVEVVAPDGTQSVREVSVPVNGEAELKLGE